MFNTFIKRCKAFFNAINPVKAYRNWRNRRNNQTQGTDPIISSNNKSSATNTTTKILNSLSALNKNTQPPCDVKIHNSQDDKSHQANSSSLIRSNTEIHKKFNLNNQEKSFKRSATDPSFSFVKQTQASSVAASSSNTKSVEEPWQDVDPKVVPYLKTLAALKFAGISYNKMRSKLQSSSKPITPKKFSAYLQKFIGCATKQMKNIQSELDNNTQLVNSSVKKNPDAQHIYKIATFIKQLKQIRDSIPVEKTDQLKKINQRIAGCEKNILEHFEQMSQNPQKQYDAIVENPVDLLSSAKNLMLAFTNMLEYLLALRFPINKKYNNRIAISDKDIEQITKRQSLALQLQTIIGSLTIYNGFHHYIGEQQANKLGVDIIHEMSEQDLVKLFVKILEEPNTLFRSRWETDLDEKNSKLYGDIESLLKYLDEEKANSLWKKKENKNDAVLNTHTAKQSASQPSDKKYALVCQLGAR